MTFVVCAASKVKRFFVVFYGRVSVGYTAFTTTKGPALFVGFCELSENMNDEMSVEYGQKDWSMSVYVSNLEHN